MKNLNIGLLGGTFNPVHNAHLWLADTLIKTNKLDEIWFIPAYLPPHKDKIYTVSMATANHRLGMLKIALRGKKQFHVKTLEIERGGKSYTYDTIKTFKKTSPNLNLFFIIGSDLLQELFTWYKIDKLCKMVTFLAVRRKGFTIPSKNFLNKYNVKVVKLNGIRDVSASMIRESIYNSESVKGLIPDDVYRYIVAHKVYSTH